MAEKKIAPYGSWKSPITSDLIVAGSIRLGEVAIDGEDLYWIEGRPAEAGRNVLVRRRPDGRIEDVTPQGFNCRTTVHEYGGGAFVISESTVYFSNFADQRMYVQTPDAPPQPLTRADNQRYADGVIDRGRGRIICVREDHTESDLNAVNTIVSVSLNPGPDDQNAGEIIISGHDFYSSPRLSPEGDRLAWLQWDHPNLPWDGTELWVADVNEDGSLGNERKVAGGPSESIFQPEWSPDNRLYFVSDRTGWWNLYRWDGKQVEPLCPREAEFGKPQWVFRTSTYAFESAARIICAYGESGTWRLASLDTDSLNLELIETPYTEINYLKAADGKVLFNGGAPTRFPSIVVMDLESGQTETLRRTNQLRLDEQYFSIPRAVEFPTENNLTAHAFYYPPQNPEYEAPAGERPPLVVISHGGPTGATSTSLELTIQFWTSRGFAMLDVNYGGSTGYGRAYRERLNGNWGIVDVNDCINGARYMAEHDGADPARLIIRGGSAGGYTTLAAMTFHNVFKAGASYYGISDLEALEKEGHKFESRYNHSLIGPYPQREKLYRERSPIHFTDRVSCPVIFFQGLEDRVVPPNQSEMMYEAVRVKGLPVAYVPFEGEQHGFRKAENIKRSLDGELYFYSKVFGFDADVRPDQSVTERFKNFSEG